MYASQIITPPHTQIVQLNALLDISFNERNIQPPIDSLKNSISPLQVPTISQQNYSKRAKNNLLSINTTYGENPLIVDI